MGRRAKFWWTGRDAPVGEYGGRVASLAVEVLRRAAPTAARLLAALSPEQVDGLYRALAKGNESEGRRIRVRTPRQAATDYEEHISGELERWLGPLSVQQRTLVTDWSRAFRSLGEVGLDYRRTWQAALRPRIDANRGAPAGMEAVIADLFARWTPEQPAVCREILAHDRALTHALIAAVLTAADAPQRAHLHRFATGLRTDLAALPATCEPPGGRSDP